MGTNDVGTFRNDLAGDRVHRRPNLWPGRWFDWGVGGTSTYTHGSCTNMMKCVGLDMTLYHTNEKVCRV